VISLRTILNKPYVPLDKKKNRWLLVIVVGVFAIFFMNLYVPFNISRWYQNEKVPLFLILSSFGIIGTIVLGVSQLYIRNLFKVHSLTWYGVVIWFLIELGLLTATMYIIYGDTTLTGSQRLGEILLTLRYTALVIIIPYAGVLLYLSAIEKPSSGHQTKNQLVKIYDENGVLHIAIDLDKILYFQSADNYVAIYFNKNDKIRKELVRTTMKKLENQVKSYPIKRCHRSYMVNMNKIAITERSPKGLLVHLLDFSEIAVPVSKNYKPLFHKWLQENTSE
jgi:hypothetical protein